MSSEDDRKMAKDELSGRQERTIILRHCYMFCRVVDPRIRIQHFS
jgi:hypothetical protein